MSSATNLAIGAGVVAVGAVYVVLHEARRKAKKAAAAARDKPVSKEVLLNILHKSAEHSKAVIQRIRVEVGKIQDARNLSAEQAHALFQQNFEHSLDQLIGAVRNQYGVSERAMDASFKQHQSDPAVQAAIQGMRLASAEAHAAGGSGGGARVTEAVPASLTRDRLKEVMTFNAVLLERELQPIKEAAARQRQAGATVRVDPQALVAVQGRISSQVEAKYGVNDEQVMAAVEEYGAREDPAFKAILQRIAQSLSGAIG